MVLLQKNIPSGTSLGTSWDIPLGHPPGHGLRQLFGKQGFDLFREVLYCKGIPDVGAGRWTDEKPAPVTRNGL
jgi:hypothetical protein